jgi:hypothetical protein
MCFVSDKALGIKNSNSIFFSKVKLRVNLFKTFKHIKIQDQTSEL